MQRLPIIPPNSTIAVLVRVSVAVKRQHEHNSSYEGKLLIMGGLQFSPLLSWKEDCGMHTDLLLEKWLNVLQPYLRTEQTESSTGSELSI